MRLTVTAKELDQLHRNAENAFCFKNGFRPDLPILRREHRGELEDNLEWVEFEQEDKPGDNVDCEYLESMG